MKLMVGGSKVMHRRDSKGFRWHGNVQGLPGLTGARNIPISRRALWEAILPVWTEVQLMNTKAAADLDTAFLR